MPNPFRLFAFGFLFAIGAATAGHYALDFDTPEEPPAPPALLPPAYANPAELVFADTLRSGETLRDLLERSEIADEDARFLLDQVRRHGSSQSLPEGWVVTYRKSYVSPAARAINMRLDADHNLFMLRDGEAWAARVEEVPVRADTIVLLGEVESSFSNALATRSTELGVTGTERQRISDHLASRIFNGHIDFRRDLRSGSGYEIVYERLVRPDGTSRSGRVLAARFDLDGRRHEAFYFRTPDGAEGYYNRRGESLRRIYFGAPVTQRRISSAFSRNRFHPILGINRPHNGVDYAAAAGTPVRATGDGVIRRAAWSGGYGNVVEIDHGHGYRSRYAHLRGFASGMRAGRRVRQGEVIGYVGMTGLATGPHLHYEFHVGGRPVDPSTPRFVLADPVPARHRSNFHSQVETKLATIQRWDESVRLADSLRLAALYRTRQHMEAFD